MWFLSKDSGFHRVRRSLSNQGTQTPCVILFISFSEHPEEPKGSPISTSIETSELPSTKGFQVFERNSPDRGPESRKNLKTKSGLFQNFQFNFSLIYIEHLLDPPSHECLDLRFSTLVQETFGLLTEIFCSHLHNPPSYNQVNKKKSE